MLRCMTMVSFPGTRMRLALRRLMACFVVPGVESSQRQYSKSCHSTRWDVVQEVFLLMQRDHSPALGMHAGDRMCLEGAFPCLPSGSMVEPFIMTVFVSFQRLAQLQCLFKTVSSGRV